MGIISVKANYLAHLVKIEIFSSLCNCKRNGVQVLFWQSLIKNFSEVISYIIQLNCGPTNQSFYSISPHLFSLQLSQGKEVPVTDPQPINDLPRTINPKSS